MSRTRRILGSGALLATICGLLGAFSLGSPSAEPRQSSDPLKWLYSEWRVMSPTEQEAYLAGFVTGAAVIEAGRQGIQDSLVTAIAKLRDARRLMFDLRPNVYLARLAEYYFWENHRGHRIAQALYRIDQELAK